MSILSEFPEPVSVASYLSWVERAQAEIHQISRYLDDVPVPYRLANSVGDCIRRALTSLNLLEGVLLRRKEEQDKAAEEEEA